MSATPPTEAVLERLAEYHRVYCRGDYPCGFGLPAGEPCTILSLIAAYRDALTTRTMPDPQTPEPRPAPTGMAHVPGPPLHDCGAYHDPEDMLCVTAVISQRDALLAENKALREALRKISQDEEISYLACPGPPHCARGDIHYIKCPVEIARAALNPESQPESEHPAQPEADSAEGE